MLRIKCGKRAGIGPEIKYMPEMESFRWFTAKDRGRIERFW